jgi:hypothetical protein
MMRAHVEAPLLVFGGPYSNLGAVLAMRARASDLGIPASRSICTGDVVAYCDGRSALSLGGPGIGARFRNSGNGLSMRQFLQGVEEGSHESLANLARSKRFPEAPLPDQEDARTITPRMKRKLPVNPASARYRLAWRWSKRICSDSTVTSDWQLYDSRGRGA